MYQVFSHPPDQPRKILGYFPGHTPGEAIAAATVALGLPQHAPHISAWLVLTRHLVATKAYFTIKPQPSGRNEGAISHNLKSTYVDCREFLGQNKHNELYRRMRIDGMSQNTNSGHVMGNGSGSGYVGYKSVSNHQEATDYLLKLGFILDFYDATRKLLATYYPTGHPKIPQAD